MWQPRKLPRTWPPRSAPAATRLALRGEHRFRIGAGDFADRDATETGDLSQRHDHAAVLWNRVVGGPVDAQVRHDRFRRSMSQPL